MLTYKAKRYERLTSHISLFKRQIRAIFDMECKIVDIANLGAR